MYEHVWSAAAGAGTLETVAYDGPFVDCGTPRAYLEANLRAVAELGRAIVDASATVGPDAVVDASVIGAAAAVEGAEDISSCGGWRGYLARASAT